LQKPISMIVDIRQPTSTTCGQTCLAMLLGVDVDTIVRRIGGGPTTWAQLRGVLVTSGWQAQLRLSPRMRRNRTVTLGDIGGTPGGVALCRVRWGDRRHGAHWVLWADEEWHDPLVPEREPLFARCERGRILSTVAAWRPEVSE
jgi:hypothetical protein